jgi:hypothetical protein
LEDRREPPGQPVGWCLEFRSPSTSRRRLTINLISNLERIQRITQRCISRFRFKDTLSKAVADIEKGFVDGIEEV